MATLPGGTYNIGAGPTGDTIDLGAKYERLTLTIDDSAAGECWVRASVGQTSAPSAPSSTPAPNDTDMSAAGWIHLKSQGSSTGLMQDVRGFRYIEVWGIADGGLMVVAS